MSLGLIFEKRGHVGSLYQVGIKGRGPAGITQLGALSIQANIKAMRVHVHKKRRICFVKYFINLKSI